tara:strand:+ start:2184 stop:2924 length:741 start_codon:yes stop_codon:yes gene_type:complete
MGYFRELPNLEYQNFLSDSISSQSYLEVKNLFRRNKIRDDLQDVFTLFDKYQIREGARPDTIAEEIYGDAELDWVVLITAGIINVRDEWPLSDRDLYYFVENKYGLTEMNKTKYYETKEVKDSLGRLILPAGKIVDEKKQDGITKDENDNDIPNIIDYYIDYYDSGDKTCPNGICRKSGDEIRVGITNFEYEVDLNNKKRSIYLLKRIYLQQFLNDMRDIMIYQHSSERINDRLIKTENTRVTMPT